MGLQVTDGRVDAVPADRERRLRDEVGDCALLKGRDLGGDRVEGDQRDLPGLFGRLERGDGALGVRAVGRDDELEVRVRLAVVGRWALLS